MRIWQPWETVWPAGVALLVLLAAVWAARGHLKWRGGVDRGAAAGLFVVALIVRLVVIPGWSGLEFDGHEAEFYDIFVGTRAVNRGGTVLYPSMQWMWWGLGQVLPHSPRVPAVVMACVGALSVLVVGATAGRLAHDPDDPGVARRIAGLAALVVALHPVHAAWSSSAYNVVVPGLFGAVVLWSGAVVGRSRHPPVAVALVGAAAWALVVATRMDAAVIGLPAALLAVVLRPDGVAWPTLLRRRLVLLAPLCVGLVLGGLGLYPLIFPGEVPGAGERALSMQINLPMLSHYLPATGGLVVWVGGGLLGLAALRRWPIATGILGLGLVVNHLLMATFNDLGDRHLLPAVPALAWFVGAGVSSLRVRWAPLLAAPVLVALCVGLVDVRDRFYASEEEFVDWLDESHPDLPRWTAEQAREGCGWINEDPRTAANPVASHFNVIDPAEAAALRGVDGCLRWCADLQDWRWSSRGVADRARRMDRLYMLEPVAVVAEPTSGYGCLVWQVGARRCCESAAQR